MATIKKKALIIGAGTGGYPCAIRLGQLGVDAMLVEKDKPGGVCLNWGCIPSKALISATKLYHKAQHVKDMGLSFGQAAVDMTQMQAWKSGIVKKLTGGVQGLVKGAGTAYVKATAEFLDAHRVKLTYADGKPEDIVEAEHIVIATGSLPIEIPGFKFDGKRVIDSTSALELTEVPKRMLCIGGGIIGLELGQTYQRLGTELIVLEGLGRILGACDSECADIVARQIKKDGGQIHVNAKAVGWEERDGQAFVKAEIGGKVQEFATDVILVGVGRRPVTRGFGLETTGVKVSQRGFIEVDNRLQTNVQRHLRGRRRGRAADAGAQGVARGRGGRRGDRRSEDDQRRAADPQRRVHRAGDRQLLGLMTVEEAEAKGIKTQHRQVPVRGQRAGHGDRRDDRAS
jgi:dihydrolipoamide dehydrogenase